MLINRKQNKVIVYTDCTYILEDGLSGSSLISSTGPTVTRRFFFLPCFGSGIGAVDGLDETGVSSHASTMFK